MYSILKSLINRRYLKSIFRRHSNRKMNPKIICILGSTGTGKSKLGIEIARKIGGEIVSADSMQVYNALDIATNKVSYEEQMAVAHHMLAVAEPWQQFTVIDFRNKIDALLNENKPIIIVGGTYYYVESILWKILISDDDECDSLLFDRDPAFRNRTTIEHDDKNIEANEISFKSVNQVDVDSISNRKLHQHLMKIDSESGKKIHFNERRKILRALQVFEKTGRKLSDILNEQHLEEGGCSISGPLRFDDVKILWLQCDDEVLKKRLDDRVDDMIGRGLVDELMDFHRRYKGLLPYTSGVYQAMGFKEFHDFLQLDRVDTPEAHELLQMGISNLKCATRQYSKKQIRFIKNRFLRRENRQVPPIYGLDTTNLDLWEERVFQPAMKIIRDDLHDGSIEPLPTTDAYNQVVDTFHCPECDVTVIGDLQWKSHVTSRRHKKHLRGLKKREKLAEHKEIILK